MSKNVLIEAVEIVGGQVALANAIKARFQGSKISQAHVWKWLNRSVAEVPPAEYVIAICETTAWKVTPHRLRPDVYPNPSDGVPAAVAICDMPQHGDRRLPERRHDGERRADHPQGGV